VATECPNLGIKTLRRELATQQQIVDRKKRASATEQPEPTNEIALQFKKSSGCWASGCGSTH
jgi:hypothetical protein